MYNLYIPLCGLVLNVLLLVLYNWKVSKVKEENAFYLSMIMDVFFMTIFCIMAVYLIYIDSPLISIIKIANKLECFFITNFFANLLMYVLYSVDIRDKRVTFGYYLINIIMLVAIFITRVDLAITNDLTYMVSVGPSINVTTVFTIVLLISIFILSLVKRRKLKQKIIPIILLLFFLIIVLIIRGVKPEFICLEFLSNIAVLIMFFTIENPDIKLINELELAKNQAEKANQAKTDFLSSMSHEIRTPLNAIVGLSEIIKNSDDLNEIHEDANDVVNASNTLLEIVNGILDISKIEANKMEIIETIYSPQEEFNSLSKLVETRIGEKDIEFKTNLALDLPEYLYGDKGKIKQIIMNLLTNAVKYTEKGHIDFKVMCVNENNNCNLTIMVKDTGRGIKKEQIDKLFTKFNRLDEDKNTTLEGTGLGLAITKSLIEMMGGKIVVDSTYGKGSKFTVFIKQKISDKELKENHSTIRNTFENKRVLLVDDNKLNLKVATKILSEYKLNIDCCESGYECLEKINNNEKYDLIFMDIMMPKLNGIETLKKLKELKNFNTPVVALTADALGEQVNKYKESGFSEYLAKPIEKEELTKVLNNVFNNGSEEYSEEKIHQVIPITDEEIELLNKKVNRSKKKKVSNKGNVDYLKENNVDIETSLSLLGSMEMYNETLKLFVEENKTRIPRIEKNKHSQNMKDYSIDVHALKSDCKYLGFKKLAELSLEHELKSKEDNIDYVNKHFDELMDEYNKVEKIINNYL